MGWPLKRYRPTKVDDGEGGWTETLAAAYNFFGMIKAHQNRTILLVDWYEDLIVGDYIGVQDDLSTEAMYRITDRQRLLGVPRAELTLERTERPISTSAS